MPCYNNNSYSSRTGSGGGSPTSILLVSLCIFKKEKKKVELGKYLYDVVLCVAQGNHTQHLHTTDEYHFLAPQLPPSNIIIRTMPGSCVHLKCSLYFLVEKKTAL